MFMFLAHKIFYYVTILIHIYTWIPVFLARRKPPYVVYYLGVLSAENMALNQPAWAPYDSPSDPARKAVDGSMATFGYTGHVQQPFLAVDLGSVNSIGTIYININRCK